MSIQFVITLLVVLLLPIFFIVSLWRTAAETRLVWLIKVITVALFILLLNRAAPWDSTSYYLRTFFIALFAFAAVISWRKIKQPTFAMPEAGWKKLASPLVELAIVIAMIGYIGQGYFYPDDKAVNVTFPLQDGRFYVGQGGNNRFLNYHNVIESQQYALDIVELNAIGRRASGLYPSDLESYVVFGTPVYSPCAGEVLDAVDGLPDQIPPETDKENLAGNHVIIECEGVKIVLAHLKQGSVAVAQGQSVSVGQQLGEIGNSGNTSEPHLHIHAVTEESADVLNGQGVPLLFNQRFLTRNTVISDR